MITYKWPGSTWDLSLCIQMDGESVRDYLLRWTKKQNSMEEVTEVQAIQALSLRVKYELLKHKIPRDAPRTMGSLMELAKKYATGEEAVRS